MIIDGQHPKSIVVTIEYNKTIIGIVQGVAVYSQYTYIPTLHPIIHLRPAQLN